MNDDFETLQSVTKFMEAQRSLKRESIRDSLKGAGVPIPQRIVDELALLNPHDALDVLGDHPGFKIWRRLKSYKTAFAVFNQSGLDLFDAIDTLAKRMRDEDLLIKPNRHKLEEGKLRIYKELFAFGNAAHSLKDHASYRLQDVASVANFKSKLAEHFDNDGLHDFVIALRTITHHVDVVEPRSHIIGRSNREPEKISFRFNRAEIHAVVESAKAESGNYKINMAGRDYLDNSPDTIDVRSTYNDYFQRAHAFHDWFQRELEIRPPEELRDFERCLKANRDNGIRTSWRIMLGSWVQNRETPPDPYQHLHKFLTPDQLEEIEGLPRKSNQQIDKVIEYIDEDDASDDEIRGLVFELFHRAPD